MKKTLFAFTATAFMMIASIVTVKAQEDSVKAEVIAPVTTPVAATTNVLGIATGSVEHSMLVEAITAAKLTKVFEMNGPYTVFAPTNAAFEKIAVADREKLMKNPAELAKILKYHVVGGTWTSTTLMAAIKQGEGFVQLPTLNGGKLKATIQDGKVMLTDEMGNAAHITNVDIAATNGIVHIVDGVVHPAKEVVAVKQ
jgi:uncharacterized surface protein with fasciclin (FAS1) repeats